MSSTGGPSNPATGGARAEDPTLWQRAQHGWPVGSPLVQFPNPPLILALSGLLIAAVTTGDVQDYARSTFYAGLAAWAWLELTDGANRARRLLGAAGLLLVVLRLGQALGA